MARRFHIGIVLLAMALMTFAGAGCVEPLQPYDVQNDPNAVMFPIRIYLPVSDVPTKAGAGDVPASVAENTLHDLQVWAFSHQDASSTAGDGEAAVAYLGLSPINIKPNASGKILEADIFFPSYLFNRPDDALKFDFYVLGNGQSIGFEPTGPTRTLTRGQLKAKTFGNTDGRGFGTVTPVVGVPREGLPLSGFFNNDGNGYDLSFVNQHFSSEQLTYMMTHHAQAYNPNDEEFEALDFTDAQKSYITSHLLDNGKWNWAVLCPQMTISRAVSKLRFVFAKSPDLLGTGIGIVSIQLLDDKGTGDDADDTGVIPDASYVFPRETGTAIDLPGDAYSIASMEGAAGRLLVGDTDIKEDKNPLRLNSTSGVIDMVSGKSPSQMTAAEYESFLNRWVGDKTSTEKIIYFRESDKPVKGRITYKFNNQVETPAAFSMPDSPSETNFYRNHSWTVYAYYSILQQRLEVTASVLPWEGKNTEGIESKQTVNVDQDGKFFVDPSVLGYGQMDTVYRAGSTTKVDHYEVHVPARNATPFNYARGRVAIYAPDGGTLIVTPKGDVDAFVIELESKTGETTTDDGKIDRSRDGGRIYVKVYRSDDPSKAVEGKKISLTFSVRLSDGRIIDADSEILDDKFEFVIKSSIGGRVYPQ